MDYNNKKPPEIMYFSAALSSITRLAGVKASNQSPFLLPTKMKERKNH